MRVPASFGRPELPTCDEKSTPAASAALDPATSTSVVDAGAASGSISSDDSKGSPPQCIMRIPMLPPDISNTCSLNPNEDRYAVTVTFTVNQEVRLLLDAFSTCASSAS
jgi:hypothetical protein